MVGFSAPSFSVFIPCYMLTHSTSSIFSLSLSHHFFFLLSTLLFFLAPLKWLPSFSSNRFCSTHFSLTMSFSIQPGLLTLLFLISLLSFLYCWLFFIIIIFVRILFCFIYVFQLDLYQEYYNLIENSLYVIFRVSFACSYKSLLPRFCFFSWSENFSFWVMSCRIRSVHIYAFDTYKLTLG